MRILHKYSAVASGILLSAAIAASAAITTQASETATYTLYRTSRIAVAMRIHVASFDTTDGAEYNRENCELAADLFQGQPGVKTRFWCEQGRFHAAPSAADSK